MMLGAAVTVVSMLPMFLVSALAVQLTDELAFGTVGLGAAVAVNRLGAAGTAPLLGRLSDRLGARRSIRIAGTIAGVCALGIAITASSWIILAVWLVLTGSANALAQPAANRLLSTRVPLARLGTAFGFKQSAPPIAAMLAGLSVPLLAVTLGWRWSFIAASVMSILVVVAVGRPSESAGRRAMRSRAKTRLEGRHHLRLLAVAFAFANLTSAATTTFYVDAAVRAGTTSTFAGTMLAVASGAAVTVRLVSGVISDRLVTGHLRLCSALIGGGAVGLALLALGGQAVMAVGVTIALAGTWGFNGVFWYALVRAYPDTPGRITGVVFPGGLIGGTVGPTMFGVIADRASYPLAWGVTGTLAVIAAMLMAASDRGLPPSTPTAA